MSGSGDYMPSGKPRQLAIVRSLNEPEKSFSEMLEQLRTYPLDVSWLCAIKHYQDRVSGRCYGMATRGYGRGSLTPNGAEVAKVIRRILKVRPQS